MLVDLNPFVKVKQTDMLCNYSDVPSELYVSLKIKTFFQYVAIGIFHNSHLIRRIQQQILQQFRD